MKGKNEFCFSETLNVPQVKAEGNIEVEGKQNSLFPKGPVIKCFVIPPNSKTEKRNVKKMIWLMHLHTVAKRDATVSVRQLKTTARQYNT